MDMESSWRLITTVIVAFPARRFAPHSFSPSPRLRFRPLRTGVRTGEPLCPFNFLLISFLQSVHFILIQSARLISKVSDKNFHESYEPSSSRPTLVVVLHVLLRVHLDRLGPVGVPKAADRLVHVPNVWAAASYEDRTGVSAQAVVLLGVGVSTLGLLSIRYISR